MTYDFIVNVIGAGLKGGPMGQRRLWRLALV